jgi:ferredoxin-NADP reductase
VAEYEMTLVDRQRIARDTMAFWFDTNGAGFGFRAGQHADFVFAHPSAESKGDNSRTFSLASSPHDKRPVMIAMRMRKTGFKSALKSAALGTKFVVSRPRGSFTLHRDVTRPAAFLAGGIGIAPIHSILQQATQEHINREMLTRYLLGLKGPVYYIAGPSGMVTAMTGLLNSSGVSEDDMRTEEFGDYKLYQSPAFGDSGTGINRPDSVV